VPIIRSSEADIFDMHGSRFNSYATTSRGSAQLCAWRLDVPADLVGVAHRPSREEILLVLDGELRVTLDGVLSELHQGDAAVVPANSELTVSAGTLGASAWVTTTPGLEAITSDGSRISPPWAQ
jgi:quercetin dioxygenase-like cupin family protein